MKDLLVKSFFVLFCLTPWACTKEFSTPSLPVSPILITPTSTATLLVSTTSTATKTLTPTVTSTPTTGICGSSNDTPSQAANILSGNIYAAYQPGSGNIFFSPFSLLTAMSMAQEGAVSSTACQMQTSLNLNSTATTRQQGFQSLISEINNPAKSYTLATANNLWPQVGYPILASYINVLQTDYYAGVTDVDFIDNPTAALNTINGAVSQETAGHIPTLLTPANIDPSTRVVLTNAIYFRDSWQYEFPVSQTAPQTFTLPSGATESVSMMNMIFNDNVGTYNGAASVLAIPYANDEASMFIFLPPLGGMAALESAMTGANINAWLIANSAAMTASGGPQVDLSLPKFTFSTNYDLTGTFKGMGMPLAFTPPTPGPGANFSGIDGNQDLYITDVVHQAYVSVSETGTTAAAATGVVMGCPDCMIALPPPPPPIPFNVNHPFIFMIVENTSNVVLFMGRVNDPLSSN